MLFLCAELSCSFFLSYGDSGGVTSKKKGRKKGCTVRVGIIRCGNFNGWVTP